MRSIVTISLISLLACSAIAAEPRSEEQLVELYKKCHAEKNLDKMMSLFCQEGTPDFILKDLRDLSNDFSLRIRNVKIQPISEEEKAKFMQSFPCKGRTLVPNLEPLKEMVVEFETVGQGESKITGQTIMIGKKEKTHYFVMSKFKENK